MEFLLLNATNTEWNEIYEVMEPNKLRKIFAFQSVERHPSKRDNNEAHKPQYFQGTNTLATLANESVIRTAI